MSKKILKFSGNQLIVEGLPLFDVVTFQGIKSAEMETLEVTVDKTRTETLSIKKVVKDIIDGRFICIYINEGDKYPYSPKVIDVNLQEHDNPRPAEQIELDEQLFVLIDAKTQRIWISDQRKKNVVADWIRGKISKNVFVKSIIDEAQFIDRIKSVSSISFSVMPGLFNSLGQDVLSHNLVQDIFGFGAEKARLEFSYNNSRISDKIKQKFKSIIQQKNDFQEITVIGRSDEDLDAVFNFSEVVAKISIEVESDEKSKLFSEKEVFSNLIAKLKIITP